MKKQSQFSNRDISIHHLIHESGYECLEIQVYPRIQIAIARNLDFQAAKSLSFKAVDYWIQQNLSRSDPQEIQDRLSTFLEYPVLIISFNY